MRKPTEFDVPPPGGGLNTVTCAVPTSRMSVAGIAALTSVGDTYVVGRSAPFQRTTDVVTNLVPVTVSVNPSPPRLADGGLMLVIVGTVAAWVPALRASRLDPATVLRES